MNTDAAMQAYLNSLSQVPGSILYRSAMDWQTLLPGTNGQVLTLDSTLKPTWATKQNYWPAMMRYNGTSGRYTTGYTSAGSLMTTVFRFASVPFTGGGVGTFSNVSNAAGRLRTTIQQGSSDHGTPAFRNRIFCFIQNSAGTIICRLLTPPTVYLDAVPRYLFFDYNGSTGAARLLINTANADDTTNTSRVAPTAATLGTGASTGIYVAYNGASAFFGGVMGCYGFHEVAGLNPLSFCNALGHPKNIESTINTVWTSQPKVWHESGKLDENRGSVGVLTAAAGVTLAEPSMWSQTQ